LITAPVTVYDSVADFAEPGLKLTVSVLSDGRLELLIAGGDRDGAQILVPAAVADDGLAGLEGLAHGLRRRSGEGDLLFDPQRPVRIQGAVNTHLDGSAVGPRGRQPRPVAKHSAGQQQGQQEQERARPQPLARRPTGRLVPAGDAKFVHGGPLLPASW
jgi:hypothetical protein